MTVVGMMMASLWALGVAIFRQAITGRSSELNSSGSGGHYEAIR